jgi:hypothetical protein
MKIISSSILFLVLALVFFNCGKKKKDGPVEPVTAPIIYQESLDIFPNPERGFIHNYQTTSEGPGLNTSFLNGLRNNNVSMIMRLYYLEKFKDKPLSEAELSLINADMQKLRDAGLKCVLRFAYTDDMTVSDAPLSVVIQHLDQLKPVFEENKDVIAFMQAGFIGAWGEWHSSSNGLATVENETKVLFKLLEVLPQDIMVQVRTPAAKQQIFNNISPVDSTIAYTAEKRARVGHHNDCFLSGETDYGTYTNVQADKEYISKEALYVPTGGETCPPEGAFPDCASSIASMKLLKWTYLNLDWYQPTISAWKTSGCFNEFQRNLGYRLLLVNASLPDKATNNSYAFEISITNKGYAPLYNYKKTHLVFKNIESGKIFSFPLDVDLRNCKPNGVLAINKTINLDGIEKGTYDLFLNITDQDENLSKRPEYSIRLANSNVWDETLGMNNLQKKVTVD